MALSNRMDFQFYTQGQSGGMMMYPFSGVLEGVKLTNTAAAGTSLTFSATAGRVRLDSVLINVPAVTGITIPVTNSVNTTGNDVTFDVFLNPVRKIPAVTSLPGSPAAGDKVILVGATADARIVTVISYKEFKGGQWVDFNPITMPPDYQHNNMAMHLVVKTPPTASQFSKDPEAVIYHKKVYPLYVNSPSNAYLRRSGAVRLATVSVIAGATPTVTIVDYDDSTLASI